MKNIIQTTQGIIEYRSEGPKTGPAMLILNGGHTNCGSLVANLPLLLELGYRVIIPSRPGYGRTPLSTGKTAEAAAEAMVALLDELGLKKTNVMAISAGGRTALQLAGRHPHRVGKLILQCALSRDNWLNAPATLAAYVMFNPITEGAFWAIFRAIARTYPTQALKSMMGGLTILDPAQVVSRMTAEQRAMALKFMTECRSGTGFWADLKHRSGDLGRITAPTLIIHSRFDGSVDFSHAEYAAQHIPQSQLFEVPAESHLMWFGPANAEIEAKLAEFLQ
ncbi:MAG: alpha/beta hydrolase [Anaerolineae bacterium]|nr:alpha/beta hydrolase [Anaerolineae bacterium]